MKSTFNNLVIFTAVKSEFGSSINANEAITFDETETNIGNGMNPSTGIFTAPVSCTYSFSFTGNIWLAAQYVTEEKALLRVHRSDESDTIDLYDQVAVTATSNIIPASYTWTMSLDQSDEIYLKFPNNKLYVPYSNAKLARFYGQLVMAL